ncbi:hypothetical protein ONZ45_g12348 [Pleurotus djamor]|nr:hypothetical protein ONZ45_g12348 [Pleurotus djamor]
MLVFNASTISLTQRAPAPPPSPELSPLCERMASLRRGTARWLAAVTKSRVVKRIQSVVVRIQTVRRHSQDGETTGAAPQVAIREEVDIDALSLVSQAGSHDHTALDVIVIKHTSFAVPSSETSERDSDTRLVMGRRSRSWSSAEGAAIAVR